MKTYLVGGCVRDKLLGIEPKDFDYVVVGSTPDELLSLGFKQVGADFPVFLHPKTKEEYALARTEKKNGVGYQGFNCDFNPSVTLQEDLARRDLTINAIAMDADGQVFDYFNGKEDIANKILRHTTNAFSDDPLRVLRVGRFLARFGPDWSVADETQQLINQMINRGCLTELTPERVFIEVEKALSEPYSYLFFDFLKDSGLFEEYYNGVGISQPVQHHPEGDVYNHQQLCLKVAGDLSASPIVKFAVMCHDFGKAECYIKNGNLHGHEELGTKHVSCFCDKLKTPKAYKELAIMVCEWHTHAHKVFEMKPKSLMKLFERTNAITKTDRFRLFLDACEIDAKGRLEKENTGYPNKQFIIDCLDAVKSVDTKDISATLLIKYADRKDKGLLIGEAIRVARIDAIRSVYKQNKI